MALDNAKLTNRQMRAGTEVCFLCGKPGADSVEHVVPRTFYPGELGPHPLRAPAHTACNRTTTKAEESFRTLLAIAVAPTEPDGDRRLFDRTMRGLTRPEAAGFRADFMSRMKRLPEGGLIGIRDGHANYTLAKICKGLAFLHHQLILRPSDVRWASRLVPGEAFDALELPTPHHQAHVATVLEAGWFSFREMPLQAFIRFYGGPIYSVTALPASKVFTARDWAAVYLPWPKPQRS